MTLITIFRSIAATAALIAAAACVTDPYQPIGRENSNGTGYRETLNEDGSYTLLFIAHAGLEGETLRELWDRRATELCGGTDYEANIFRAIMPTVLYDYYGGRPGVPEMEGYVRCADTAEGDDPKPDTTDEAAGADTGSAQ